MRCSPRILRRSIQALFTGICLLAGIRLYLFCLWASGRSELAVWRSPVAEGFLPISALLGLKSLAFTGSFDPVHPAGLTILLAALATAILLRKGFCGYICPIGLLSDLTGGLGQRLGLERKPPTALDRVLRHLKFLFLALCLYPFLSMDLGSIQAFLASSYNITADARMLQLFLHPSQTTLAVLGFLIVLGLVFRNGWCRWLCPYGALLGLAALAGPAAIHRDARSCLDCGRCERACPSAIAIRRKTSVRSAECLGCAQCVGACPSGSTLSVRAVGLGLPWYGLGLGTVLVVIAAWLAAVATGHWDSSLPPAMLRALYARSLGF